MSAILKLKDTSSKPIRRGHDWYWQVMRKLTEENTARLFMISDILKCCPGVKKPAIQVFLRLLIAAQILEKIPAVFPGQPNQYRLLRRPIDTPVLSRNGKTTSGQSQTNMWNTMCHALKAGFSIHDLCTLASTVDVPIPPGTAKSYVVALNRAGMMIKTGKSVATIWRLKPSANTGPKAPKILRSKMVYDANQQKIVGDVIAEEVTS